MAQRKIKLRKDGKPDKRYVKSTRSKSKATGKTPSKRLQKRRAKPIKDGYTANPRKRVNGYRLAIIERDALKPSGWWNGYDWDTVESRGLVLTLSEAKKAADNLRHFARGKYSLMADNVKK